MTVANKAILKGYLYPAMVSIHSSRDNGKAIPRNAKKGHCSIDWTSYLIALDMIEVERDSEGWGGTPASTQ